MPIDIPTARFSKPFVHASETAVKVMPHISTTLDKAAKILRIGVIVEYLRAGAIAWSYPAMFLATVACFASRRRFAFRPRRLVASYRAPQARYFSRLEFAECSGLNIERERSITDALDFFHVMSNLLEHPADLPVLSLD
jgi:hypothetical protein